mgnify:FL=1
MAGTVSNSVVLGESPNKGYPSTGFDRSIPYPRQP